MNSGIASSAAKVFLSYRRQDSSGYTRLLYDRLNSRFPGQIFMDINGIGLGADFVNSIRGAVAASSVLVALIGKDWLTITGADGRPRLQDSRDFVRIEIRSALERGIRVIPVLLPGAAMPSVEELPQDMAALAHRQALHLTDVDLDQNIAALIQTLDLELKSSSDPIKSLILRSSMVSVPLSLIVAFIGDLTLPSTDLTPRVTFACVMAALLFAALKLVAPYADFQKWPQLIRNQNIFVRMGVFFTSMALMFGSLIVAQRVTGADHDKGILATKIQAIAKIKKSMFISNRIDTQHTLTDADTYASSPSASGMPSNSGWMISFQVPDRHPKEILYKLNNDSAFVSTGSRSRDVDPITGLPTPNYNVTIPNLKGPNVISLKYIDAQGKEHGPFLLPFDTNKEYISFVKEVLNEIPIWVSFREYPKGRLLVYFTDLISYKNAFREIRYSVDNESLSRQLTFMPDWDSPEGPKITDKDEIYVNIPMSTKFVCVKLIFADNTESSTKKFTLMEVGVTGN